jgi:hypothetical protein
MPKGIFIRTEQAKRNMSFSMKRRNYSGQNNPAYKGGKVQDTNGYIRMRGSREARQYEHQFVMENYLHRKLTKGEEVHHINGNKTDNRVENLYLVDKKNHSRNHFKLFLEVQKLEWENIWLKKELERLGWKPKSNKR